jgi:hypothetical protein
MAEENPETWAKFPWQKAIIICLSAIVFLFGIIIKSGRDDKERETERVNNFRTLFKEKDSVARYYQEQLYRCKDESARYFRTQDSTNRAVLDQPAKDLLKQLKR